MSESEHVEHVGFGANLMESIKGVAVGGILFLLSFWVLWWGEGRIDLSDVAKKSVEVKADSVDKSAEGKLISVTGELKSDEKLDDPQFLLPGNYLRLERTVEMYAWVERRRTETTKKTGGGKDVRTIPTYEKKWTSDPQPPSKFLEPKDRENPPLTLEGRSVAAEKAQVGAYPFKPKEATLPSGELLKLTDDMLTGLAKPVAAEAPKATDDAAKPAEGVDGDKADGGDKADAKDDGAKAKDDADDEKPKKKDKKKRKGRSKIRSKPNPAIRQAAVNQAERKAAAIAARKPDGFARANDNYLFKGSGSIENPEIGDVRVGFRALQPGQQVTLFGQLKDGEVAAYAVPKDGAKFLRAIPGGREDAIRTLATEHSTTGWILRVVGFLMMWFGLMMFFGPINALLDVIPFLGSAGRVLIGIAMFPVALVLTFVTVILSIIFHNPILLTLFLVALGAGGYFLYQKKKRG